MSTLSTQALRLIRDYDNCLYYRQKSWSILQ